MRVTENGLENKVRIFLTQSRNLFLCIMFTEKFYCPFTTFSSSFQLRSGFRLYINRAMPKAAGAWDAEGTYAPGEGKEQLLLKEISLQVPFQGWDQVPSIRSITI